MVMHPDRPDIVAHACAVSADLIGAGFTVGVIEDEAGHLDLPGVVPMGGPGMAAAAEIVLALGGDGTLLRAAELARPAGVPLLGINLGKVGFLAEAEPDDVDAVVRQVVDDAVLAESWALNEASVEKHVRERMLEVRVDIDGRPLSRYGCDGVVCATPTGSTAYAFSGGGPVVWPEVEALLLVPISAHALYSRALVTAPSCTITITIDPNGIPAVLCCDGRRCVQTPPGSRITLRRGALPVLVARLKPQPFTDRLVLKFGLPVSGWRGTSLD
jgi:NAD+ kinase